MDDTEKEIRSIQKETLISLDKERQDLVKKLAAELRNITVSWKKE